MDELTISGYQEGTEKTAIYRDGVHNSTGGGYIENWSNLAYVALGLAGEAGEFAGSVKKAVRDEDGFISPIRKEELFKELGDVAWYLSQACTELGLSLQAVLDYNLTKLESRKDRGVLTGSGDNR